MSAPSAASVVLLLACVAPLARADDPALAGTWALDAAQAAAVTGQLQQLFPEQKKHGWFGGGSGDAEGPGGRHHGHRDAEGEGRHGGGHGAGGLRGILAATRLAIDPVQADFVLTYDDQLLRKVKPNPAGHVYSASGQGTTSDHFGETLTWWEGRSLVIETRTERDAVLTERYTRNPADGRIAATYELDLPGHAPGKPLGRVFSPLVSNAR